MGLLQRAIETYDANTALIGVYRDGHEPLAPIGHILTSANIEITLNAQGNIHQPITKRMRCKPRTCPPIRFLRHRDQNFGFLLIDFARG